MDKRVFYTCWTVVYLMAAVGFGLLGLSLITLGFAFGAGMLCYRAILEYRE